MLTDKQKRIARRFERLVAAANAAGLFVVADAEEMGIRLIPQGQASHHPPPTPPRGR